MRDSQLSLPRNFLSSLHLAPYLLMKQSMTMIKLCKSIFNRSFPEKRATKQLRVNPIVNRFLSIGNCSWQLFYIFSLHLRISQFKIFKRRKDTWYRFRSINKFGYKNSWKIFMRGQPVEEFCEKNNQLSRSEKNLHLA